MKSISDSIKYLLPITTGTTYLDYQIYINNNLVYTGKAYPIPNTLTVLLDIKEVVQDYLGMQTIINDSNLFTHSIITYPETGNVANISIRYKEPDDIIWLTYDGITDPYIHYSWNTDFDIFNYSSSKLLQLKNEYTITDKCISKIQAINVTGSTQTAFLMQPEGYAQATNSVLANSTAAYNVNPALYPNASKINYSFQGDSCTVNILRDCNRYSGCLYFINRFGGMEMLLINTSSKRSEDIERILYSKNNYSYNGYNITKQQFENTVLQSNNKTKWLLNTDLLSDTDGYWLEHLYSSPYVWYLDFKTMFYNAVVVTDNTIDFKTFKNTGKRIPSYNINIEYSQTNYRR